MGRPAQEMSAKRERRREEEGGGGRSRRRRRREEQEEEEEGGAGAGGAGAGAGAGGMRLRLPACALRAESLAGAAKGVRCASGFFGQKALYTPAYYSCELPKRKEQPERREKSKVMKNKKGFVLYGRPV